ncbi:uncharacterized protein LOC132546277 isoform X2 [Ylistrum balloti]|uniref:uncharacterized protein LOC132546277 isoform X2 n=1 Tax=Ylistrum balloti TaxID=509963 RepID=UPI002905B3F5|nr:uncharacterized protein LOC132546277 isoform X2 [Ylistrum balloti]XP_060065989.1 uncharacterized protein LOC132546277 isoform X2 [Ylistrum balloti]XP_060065998.1 uncharacterized protein LOC132546277 isoform X2 [Ylistrum balloti]XP_060066007.1 uncharacterized protein LOC132546277 isoform X2 [Ylistrum balloti]
MRRSTFNVIGISCTSLNVLLTMLAFAPPYWLISAYGRMTRLGLWASCNDVFNQGECIWSMDSRFGYQDSLPQWFKATQGLMSVGLGLALLALIVATLALCCQCHGCNYASAVAGLLLMCFLCIGVAVALFGIKASQDFNAVVTSENFALGQEYKYAWSFWLAVGAAGMALITSIVYGCAGLNTKY